MSPQLKAILATIGTLAVLGLLIAIPNAAKAVFILSLVGCLLFAIYSLWLIIFGGDDW